ncbi:hypothetical protein AB0H76_32370 [Nocardia sp. NPDC050712]|uniref:hypothetical protein n=1 Tax=Nocardia sp. NPDC050712 TaxID=3155518 RepID=UPI0033D9B04F
MLSIVAALAAGAAVIVSVAMIMRSEEPADDAARVSAAYSAIPNSPTVAPPPAPPFPARQVGDDCSAGGVQARWEMRRGTWNCAAVKLGPNGKTVGEDCSRDGVAKRWGFLPDGSWACSPPPATVAGAPPPPPAPPVPAPPPPPPPVPEVPPPAPEPVAPPPAYEPQYVPEYSPPPAPEPVEEAPAPPPPPPPPPPMLPHIELPPLPFFPPR